ncbi:MAG: transporter substrate-binding domain-containing protein [Thiomargarita sp.]|nr:transporter substrate-binding domain-containing protein [Thiomargarita sp.]
MKKLFITTILLVSIMQVNVIAAALEIIIDPYLPFSDLSNSQEEGYATEIVKIIFSEHKLLFRKMPYVRSLLILMLKTGKIDIIFVTAKIDFTDKEKENIIFPQETIGTSLMSFFVKRNNEWRFEGLDSLEGIRLGLINGLEYTALEDFPNKSKFSYLSGNAVITRSLRKLLAGRISAYYEDYNVVQYYAMKMDITDKIKAAGNANDPLPLYIAISKKTPFAQKLANEFDNKMEQLRKSGQLEKILQKYNLKDWK